MKYDDDTGYYLLYYDSRGERQNDTYHDSLELALNQAFLEFKARPEDWEVLE
ncbi:MAG TPA: hypothetical protein VN934_06470 [Candidatus Tumulicola sp.]|nr:hypothetical protein [Candidatus Tumulicola sp.]